MGGLCIWYTLGGRQRTPAFYSGFLSRKVCHPPCLHSSNFIDRVACKRAMQRLDLASKRGLLLTQS